jgi:hypothetical protein
VDPDVGPGEKEPHAVRVERVEAVVEEDGGEGRDDEQWGEGLDGPVGEEAEEREQWREGERVGVTAVVFEVGGGVVGEGSVLVEVGEVGGGDEEEGGGFGAREGK